MLWFDWVLSASALVWLILLAQLIFREKKIPGPIWTGIPLIFAAIYRLLTGQYGMVVAAAAVVLIISERRHLHQRLLEGIILAASIIVIIWMMFTTDITTGLGIVAVLIFWISWELHFLESLEDMALITCVIIWPGMEFLVAYLAAGLFISLWIRIKQGDWLKRHDVPGILIIIMAVVLFLGFQLYRVVV